MTEDNELIERAWFPHLDFAGEPMLTGEFREPYPMAEERAKREDRELIREMAAAIMEAREGCQCMVRDWEVEARDNPHVALALRQASAALTAYRNHQVAL